MFTPYFRTAKSIYHAASLVATAKRFPAFARMRKLHAASHEGLASDGAPMDGDGDGDNATKSVFASASTAAPKLAAQQ